MEPTTAPGTITIGHGLRAGAVSGVVAAVAGVLAHFVVTAITGESYAQLSPISIPIATIVAALLGGVVFALLTRWTRRPAAVLAGLAALAAVADTGLAALAGQGPGFVLEAGVLHVVVAGVVAVLLPRIAVRRG